MHVLDAWVHVQSYFSSGEFHMLKTAEQLLRRASNGSKRALNSQGESLLDMAHSCRALRDGVASGAIAKQLHEYACDAFNNLQPQHFAAIVSILLELTPADGEAAETAVLSLVESSTDAELQRCWQTADQRSRSGELVQPDDVQIRGRLRATKACFHITIADQRCYFGINISLEESLLLLSRRIQPV
jgi:hypothetical protein